MFADEKNDNLEVSIKAREYRSERWTVGLWRAARRLGIPRNEGAAEGPRRMLQIDANKRGTTVRAAVPITAREPSN